MPRQAHGRQLLAGSRDVTTGEELAAAIRDNVGDIRIIEHIDLSSIQSETASDQARGSRTLPDVLSPTSSIRGECLTAPSNETLQVWNVTSTPPLLERTERQCLIVCDTDCMTIKAEGLWMDSIYWRFKRTERSDSSSNESVDTQVPQMLTVSELGQLYMSNVTIQGDGQLGRRDATQAVFLPDVSSHIFAEDLIVDSVGGKQTSALDIFGSASFLNSTFQNNKIKNGKEYAIIFVRQRGKLMLREATVTGNSARFDVGKNKNGLVYLQPEQKEDIKVKALDVTFSDDLDYDDLTIDVAEAPEDTFKSENDIFYRRQRGEYLDFVKPLKDGGVNLSSGAIAGIAAACFLAIAAVIAVIAFFVLRQRKKKKTRGMVSLGSSEYSKEFEEPVRPPSPGRGKSPFSSAAYLSRDVTEHHDQNAFTRLPDATRSTISTTHSARSLLMGNQAGGSTPNPGKMKPPSSDSSIKERLAWVHWQLDQFDDQNLILKRYQSLGPAARRQGGQAVVQFARNVLDQREYALKVFAVSHAYQAEAAMYQDESMANFLPRVEGMHDGTDDDVVDPSGHKLPPVIIMEKGESLNEWSARAEPDLFMSIAVLANVALRLAEFHAAGYVHRDLKPANVMWLPRENRWTVIDFGCAGKIGATVPLSFTLVYAAPEVIGALQDGDKTITADPALDTWALGVMAFELLSGKPAFHVLSDGKSEVIKQLTGEKRLPWEEQGPAAAERLESLGVFKGAVLQLLNRDPTLRPSMQRFYDAANRIFSSRTTIKI